MKRKVFPILSLVCVLTLLFSLCSCSSGFKGKYRSKMIIDSGYTYKLGDTYKDIKLTKDFFILNVKKDNTVDVTIADTATKIEMEGVWIKNTDNTYTCLFGNTLIFSVSVDGNTATVSYLDRDLVIILEK